MADVVVPHEVAQIGYSVMEQRKKIALALLARKKSAYPKNIGEGLAHFGDALGDIGMMRMLEAQQAQQSAADAQGAQAHQEQAAEEEEKKRREAALASGVM